MDNHRRTFNLQLSFIEITDERILVATLARIVTPWNHPRKEVQRYVVSVCYKGKQLYRLSFDIDIDTHGSFIEYFTGLDERHQSA